MLYLSIFLPVSCLSCSVNIFSWFTKTKLIWGKLNLKVVAALAPGLFFIQKLQHHQNCVLCKIIFFYNLFRLVQTAVHCKLQVYYSSFVYFTDSMWCWQKISCPNLIMSFAALHIKIGGRKDGFCTTLLSCIILVQQV